jgi:hypothetical protein
MQKAHKGIKGYAVFSPHYVFILAETLKKIFISSIWS